MSSPTLGGNPVREMNTFIREAYKLFRHAPCALQKQGNEFLLRAEILNFIFFFTVSILSTVVDFALLSQNFLTLPTTCAT